jgi:glucose-6-phosphate 1-dehydrogenase
MAINLKSKKLGQPGDPCVIVIFGAAGDLTKRKLIPALYNLACSGLLPKEFAVVGFARSEMNTEDFRQKMSHDIHSFSTSEVDSKIWDDFGQKLYYLPGDFQEAAAYQQLKALLAHVDQECSTRGNYLYYLATPHTAFGQIVQQLGDSGLVREEQGCWRRVIIEKPFGHDLESARALNRDVNHVLREHQIYRIDHYLGKETVQNILLFRFGNGIFEPIWNHLYIDHVQITVTESVGVEGRGGYYDRAGALRDMIPNHLFQLLALTAMEPPISFEADAVRDEKTKVLRAIQPMPPEEVLTRTVRGQYDEGRVRGERVSAYRSEPRVDPNSTTETYAALKLIIDNWRWAEVPFYLRTGKYLPERVTEIAIQFKRPPFLLFRDTSIDHLTPNFLVLRIQPKEGISLQFGAKVPGPVLRMGAVDMDFQYANYFGTTPNTGYETLLYDCMIGDATLFQRADNLEAGWSVVAPILDVWQALPTRNFPNYAAGTWGPTAADKLLEQDGRRWRDIDV